MIELKDTMTVADVLPGQNGTRDMLKFCKELRDEMSKCDDPLDAAKLHDMRLAELTPEEREEYHVWTRALYAREHPERSHSEL